MTSTDIVQAVFQWCLQVPLLPSSLEPKNEYALPSPPSCHPRDHLESLEREQRTCSVSAPSVSEIESLPQMWLVWINLKTVGVDIFPQFCFLVICEHLQLFFLTPPVLVGGHFPISL